MEVEIKRPYRKRFGYNEEYYDLVVEKKGKSRKELVEEVANKLRLDFPFLLVPDNPDRLRLLNFTNSSTDLVLNYVFTKSYL